MNVDRAGTFRVKEIDRALAASSKQGLAELHLHVQILEYYDTQEDAWVDFSECNMETIAYFNLVFYNKKGDQEVSLNYKQLMEVFGWDGRDLQELITMDIPDVFQIRIEDNDPEYAAKRPFIVNWINNKDADPRGGLKKLDAKGVKDLQSKFGALLKKSGKAAAPATAKKAPPVAPKTGHGTASEAIAAKKAEKPATSKVEKQTKSDRIKKANEKLRKEVADRKPPTPPEPVDKQTEEHRDGFTKQEAWEFVIEMQDKECTDEQRTAAWRAAISEITEDVDEKEITPQQWHEICHKTLDDIGAL